MLITIHGYYGYGNLGDDLMLYLLLERLAQRYEDVRFRVLHHREAEAGLIPSPPNVNVELRAVTTWRDRFAAVRGSSALVFGGGTCLHRFGFCGLYNNLAARCLGIPVIWLGVGADDVGTGKTKWKAQLALQSCHTASWRDQPSAQVAGELVSRFRDSIVAEDLAFLLADSPALSKSVEVGGRCDTTPTLAVGWRDFHGYLSPAMSQNALKHGADAIAHVAARHGLQVRVIDIADLIDHDVNCELTSELRARGANVQHTPGVSMIDKIQAIRSAHASIFARLHGVFLGKLFQKPSVGVSYASKLDNFGALFDQPPIVPLSSVAEDSSELQVKLQAELAQPSNFVESLSEHARRAGIHIDLLHKSLRRETRRVA